MRVGTRSQLVGLALVFVLAAAAACDRREPEPPPAAEHTPATGSSPQTRPSDGKWTADEIASDPAGYRAWWEKQSAQHIEQYRQRLAEVQTRTAAFERSWETLSQNLLLAQSLQAQVSRAQSLIAGGPEQKFIIVSGRKIERDAVAALLDRLDRHVRATQPLVEQARKLADAHASRTTLLEMQIERIERLKQRAIIEIELVKDGGSALGVDFESVEQQLNDLSLSRTPEPGVTPDVLSQPLPATLPTTRPIQLLTVQELLNG